MSRLSEAVEALVSETTKVVKQFGTVKTQLADVQAQLAKQGLTEDEENALADRIEAATAAINAAGADPQEQTGDTTEMASA